MKTRTTDKKKIFTIVILILMGTFFFLTGCESQDGPAEKAGEKIDQTVEDIGDAVGNSLEEAGDSVKDATN